jgi:hypothetical protein
MMKLYRYVGPKGIADRARTQPAGHPIRSPADLRAWVKSSDQEVTDGCVIATFVVDASGLLHVADRRSEHVACASGEPVLSAGEMTFVIGRSVEISEVSNQSTGYCPEPESWPAVAAALQSAGLAAPMGFSLECVFRRCKCGNVNVVKDGVLECGLCGAGLAAAYNVQ